MRFGAYHIYVPALLKPAPRVLATQLYALKHEGAETQGLEAIQQLAASRPHLDRRRQGRSRATSIASPASGVCGERAVRVDILERLADIIRPALAWRAGRARPAAGGRRRWLRLHGDDGDDVARRLLGRGFRVGAARARLPHGEAAEAAAGAGARALLPRRRPLETPATEAASGDAANAEALLRRSSCIRSDAG